VKITGHDEGILCAPTFFGKTVVAAWLIAKRKVNTLVIVHRQ
jgi:superfamily II DNA or RNA helicase